uniref:Uncharacterized protein n=1 Tax=viral metagenome TaxID=1070528 RepID=A0A6C0LM15_9ZZZZ
MFSLSTIVSNIEIARKDDIRMANYQSNPNSVVNPPTLSKPLTTINTKPLTTINTKPKMIDKSTMTEIQTTSVYCDTKELETINNEMKALELFKKQREEKITQAALMNAYLELEESPTIQKTYEEVEDE